MCEVWCSPLEKSSQVVSCADYTVVWCNASGWKRRMYYMVQSAGKGESGCIVLYHMYSVLYHVCSVVGSAMQAARKGEPGCRSDTVIAALCCVIMPIVAVLYCVISCV